MLTLLLVIVVLAVLFGGWSLHPAQRDSYGYWGWSPLGLVLIILLILWLMGGL